MPDVLPTEVETELAVAARHVARARMIVAQQRDRVIKQKARGALTRDYEFTLDVFISTLQSLEHHERALRAAVAARFVSPVRAGAGSAPKGGAVAAVGT